jgi:hypothetical protein
MHISAVHVKIMLGKITCIRFDEFRNVQHPFESIVTQSD